MLQLQMSKMIDELLEITYFGFHKGSVVTL